MISKKGVPAMLVLFYSYVRTVDIITCILGKPGLTVEFFLIIISLPTVPRKAEVLNSFGGKEQCRCDFLKYLRGMGIHEPFTNSDRVLNTNLKQSFDITLPTQQQPLFYTRFVEIDSFNLDVPVLQHISFHMFQVVLRRMSSCIFAKSRELAAMQNFKKSGYLQGQKLIFCLCVPNFRSWRVLL